MLNTSGFKLEPFLETVALIICQDKHVGEVGADGIMGASDTARFFYLGADWRALVEKAEIGWNVFLINPGIPDAQVKAVEDAARVILNQGNPTGLYQ